MAEELVFPSVKATEFKEPEHPIDIEFDNVLGPFIYSAQIPESSIPFLFNRTIQLFVPIKALADEYMKVRSHILTGNNIYPIQTSLISIIFHMGVLYPTRSSGSSVVFDGSRVVNVFDEKFGLIQQERAFVPAPKKEPLFAGVSAIVKLIEAVPKFEGGKSFEIKSKSSKNPGNGIAFIYGEPVYSVPSEVIDISAIECVAYSSGTQYNLEDTRWLRFSLSNEPMPAYDIRNFIDYDRPLEAWLTQRFRKLSLIFELSDGRYEIIAIQGGSLFRLSKIKANTTLASIKSDGTPLKEDKKETIADNIDWTDILWSDTSVTINDVEYGPILGALWVKRKRIL